MNTVGIRLKESGKIYIFVNEGLSLLPNDRVIVETDIGERLGIVVQEKMGDEGFYFNRKIKKVLRKATQIDIERDRLLREKEKSAYQLCLERIDIYELPIKLVDVTCLADGNKIIFYFTAEHRVDFRELVKSLVHELRIKVEMRQIGVRNEAQIIGGVGSCGRELCCCTFLSNFEPVSVRMAKDQNLSLNPLKISGVCGRLMCCLSFEHKAYLGLKRDLPNCKKKVATKFGVGEVKRHNILMQKVVVELQKGNEVEMELDDIYDVISDSQKDDSKS